MKVAIQCPCGRKIEIKKSLAQRKKYCSKPCFYRFRIRPTGLFYILKKKNPTSFKKGSIAWNKGIKLFYPVWNKGTAKGYINIHGYKCFDIKGKKSLEHRIIIEKQIKRKLLSDEIIHHIDGNKLNNDIINLMIMDRSSHTKLHNQKRLCV